MILIARLNEWLEQCDTLQSSHIMSDEEIIEYAVKLKGKEDHHENETADLAAVENEGIEFIGILEKFQNETQRSPHKKS